MSLANELENLHRLPLADQVAFLIRLGKYKEAILADPEGGSDAIIENLGRKGAAKWFIDLVVADTEVHRLAPRGPIATAAGIEITWPLTPCAISLEIRAGKGDPGLDWRPLKDFLQFSNPVMERNYPYFTGPMEKVKILFASYFSGPTKRRTHWLRELMRRMGSNLKEVLFAVTPQELNWRDPMHIEAERSRLMPARDGSWQNTYPIEVLPYYPREETMKYGEFFLPSFFPDPKSNWTPQTRRLQCGLDISVLRQRARPQP